MAACSGLVSRSTTYYIACGTGDNVVWKFEEGGLALQSISCLPFAWEY